MEVSPRGIEISNADYQSALLLQLEDLILNFNPSWGSVLTKGRTEAKNFLPAEVAQCFNECGLFGKLTDDLIRYWDKLALAYRNYTQKKMTEIGRTGEKLSYEFELNRTGQSPKWQAVESNLSGFDILSIVSESDDKKLKIEVKTTSSSLEYAKLHLSKHEWNTAKLSMNYIFHLWTINAEPKLYEVTVDKMSEHVPEDKGEGEWESVEIPFKTIVP